MVIRAQVADLKTGERIQTLPTVSGRWEQRILSPEAIKVDLTLKPRAHQRLDIRNSTTEVKSALIVADDDHVLGAGPIWEREYDDETRRWSGDAAGIWDLLNHRHVLPDHVTAANLLIQSGEDEGEPNPAVQTRFEGRSWPYIVRRLIEQSMGREGGELPIAFGSDGVGAHDKGYDASSFKTIGEALDDLTQLMNGPEISFVPQKIDNRLRWLCRVGDDSQLEVTSGSLHSFDFTAPRPSVRRLKVRSSGRGLASEAWGSAGRQESVAIYARSFSRALLQAGFPRMELVTADHSTVTDVRTLQRYTDAHLQTASAPSEFWSWQFHADRYPRLADVRVGDYCTVKLKGNPYLPDGEHRRRIVGLAGDFTSRWVQVTTDEEVTW